MAESKILLRGFFGRLLYEASKNREMKWIVIFLLILVSRTVAVYNECDSDWPLAARPHSVSVSEFGAVGDGKTLNTVAFQNAIFYLQSFADKGGARLYVPAGKWLIGCINLISHLTLFLEKDAIILGSQDYSHWDLVPPLPSYGRGLEIPGQRYHSLISGQNLTDVVITGNNGTIDGQGFVWWEQVASRSLNHSRPNLLEFIGSNNIFVSNLTFLNAPAWSIHPVYCSNVLVRNITVYSAPDSPHTSGIVPDSSNVVCIENSNISTGHDAIVLKSGWDEYGISYNRSTTNIHIRRVQLKSYSGSGFALGSEMSGGISDILLEHILIDDSLTGLGLKTGTGRGGYIKNIFLYDIYMQNIQQGIEATGRCDSHPDDGFDPLAVPVVSDIVFEDIVGLNITTAGTFLGIKESPFTWIRLFNVSFSIKSDPSSPWLCSDVNGKSADVSPVPCPELLSLASSGYIGSPYIVSVPEKSRIDVL